MSFIDKKFAFNSFQSQPGYAAAYNYVSNGTFFRQIELSGSHSNSSRMFSNGDTDIACLDQVSWQHIKSFDGFAVNLIEIEKTNPTPGLPLITVKYGDDVDVLGDHVDVLYSLIQQSIRNLSSKSTAKFLFSGLTWIDSKEYCKISDSYTHLTLPTIYTV